MNANRSHIAGNGAVQPAGPRRLPHQHHTLNAVSYAAIILVLTAIFSLAATAGYAGRNVAARKAGTHRNTPPGLAALSVDDLPATLNLSPQQRTELASALTDLRQDRSAVGQRLGIGRRARDREDNRPPYEGRRGVRARLHPGDRSRWCDGSGPGGGPDRGVRMERGGRPGPCGGPDRGDRMERRNRPGAGRGPGAGFEPPMIGFLEKASSILSADQFVTLTRHLAERRTEMLRERASDRHIDRQARHVDRITGMYLRVLGLDDAQASQVRQIMAATIPARRAVAERQAREALAPEDFAHEMMTIEKNAAGQVREVLTPDQAKRFDALVDLLPRGPRAGGPGGPMLDPLGGPPRGPGPGPMRGPDRGPRAAPEGSRSSYR